MTVNAAGAGTVSAANAVGTTHDATTRRLAAAKLVAQGAHKLFLVGAAGLRAPPVGGTPIRSRRCRSAPTAAGRSRRSAGRGAYTFRASQGATNGETAFNDPIRFVVDKTAPQLTSTAKLYGGKTRDKTPLLSGVAGVANGDGATVTVRLFRGPTATGARWSPRPGRRTFSVGTRTRTLRNPGVASFSFRPSRGLARRIRRGRGVIALCATFVDDQGRTYRRTQRVGFR